MNDKAFSEMSVTEYVEHLHAHIARMEQTRARIPALISQESIDADRATASIIDAVGINPYAIEKRLNSGNKRMLVCFSISAQLHTNEIRIAISAEDWRGDVWEAHSFPTGEIEDVREFINALPDNYCWVMLEQELPVPVRG